MKPEVCHACAVVGSGCGVEGRAALTVGTSAAVRILTDSKSRWERPLPRALFGYLLDGAHPVVGAARSNAGDVAAWARAVLGIESDPPIASWASKVRLLGP